jgi:hypothetical protein
MPATSFTFFGNWSLDVTSNDQAFSQRVQIQNSANADGVLAAYVGAQIASIDGSEWQILLERSSDGGATWQHNQILRTIAVTPQNGLTVTLYGDDSDSLVPGVDTNVIVELVYLNQQINPHPAVPPYNFTLPSGSFWPQRPANPCECCGKPRCCCRLRRSRGRSRACC